MCWSLLPCGVDLLTVVSTISVDCVVSTAVVSLSKHIISPSSYCTTNHLDIPTTHTHTCTPPTHKNTQGLRANLTLSGVILMDNRYSNLFILRRAPTVAEMRGAELVGGLLAPPAVHTCAAIATTAMQHPKPLSKSPPSGTSYGMMATVFGSAFSRGMCFGFGVCVLRCVVCVCWVCFGCVNNMRYCAVWTKGGIHNTYNKHHNIPTHTHTHKHET